MEETIEKTVTRTRPAIVLIVLALVASLLLPACSSSDGTWITEVPGNPDDYITITIDGSDATMTYHSEDNVATIPGVAGDGVLTFKSGLDSISCIYRVDEGGHLVLESGGETISMDRK